MFFIMFSDMGAVLERGDVEDALVMSVKHNKQGSLASLPEGSKIGTSALRRMASIARHHQGLVCQVNNNFVLHGIVVLH